MRKRSAWVLAGVAATAALAAGGFVLLSRDGTPPRQATEACPPAPAPEGPAEHRELVSLLAGARCHSFHARYTASSGEPGSEAETTTLEIWRKPPRTRQDTELTTTGQLARTSSFLLPERVVTCVQAGADWRCRRAAAPRAGDPGTFFNQVMEQVRGRRVEARAETVAGREARCFRLIGEGEESEVCVTRTEGIPVRVSVGTARFELVELDFDVPADVFTPPAEARES